MPRKIRQLIADLKKASFVNRGGKGSHRNFEDGKGNRVTLSGKGRTRSPTRNARYARTSKGASIPISKAEAQVTGATRPRRTDYLKLVEWSEEDGCYVGSALPLIGQCCHGSDPVEVYKELCEIVEEWLEIMAQDGTPIPSPAPRKTYSGKFNLRTGADLHKILDIRATQAGESLNAYCVRQLTKATQR